LPYSGPFSSILHTHTTPISTPSHLHSVSLPHPQWVSLASIIARALLLPINAAQQVDQPFPPAYGIYDPLTGGPATVSWLFVVLIGHAASPELSARLAALPTADDPIMRGAGFTFEQLVPTIRDMLTSGMVRFEAGDLAQGVFYITADFQDRLMREMDVQGVLAPLEAWIRQLVCACPSCINNSHNFV
jgi:hypothetical protein